MKNTIQISPEIKKRLTKIGVTESMFTDNAERYIKAIKEGRMCCIITSVSKSGMSRNLKFIECSPMSDGYQYLQFYLLFKAFGYTNKDDSFRVNGCGMDMVFHTNYSIIHSLRQMGFISKEECNVLAQKTPTVL